MAREARQAGYCIRDRSRNEKALGGFGGLVESCDDVLEKADLLGDVCGVLPCDCPGDGGRGRTPAVLLRCSIGARTFGSKPAGGPEIVLRLLSVWGADGADCGTA